MQTLMVGAGVRVQNVTAIHNPLWTLLVNGAQKKVGMRPITIEVEHGRFQVQRGPNESLLVSGGKGMEIIPLSPNDLLASTVDPARP